MFLNLPRSEIWLSTLLTSRCTGDFKYPPKNPHIECAILVLFDMHTNIIWSIKTRFVLNLNENII
jgi:hypothetical protein